MIMFSVRRPITILMVCIGLILLGILSSKKIPIQLLPEFLTPEFKIITVYKGATPLEVEEQITIPLERALSTVSGLKSSSSISKSEKSEILLKFSSKINYIETLSLIKDKIDSAYIPEEALRPRITRFQSNTGPLILTMVASKGQRTLYQLSKDLNEDLVKNLEKISGVALVNIIGAPEKVLMIKLDPVKLQAYSIDVQQIPALIRSQNKIVAAGSIKYNGKDATIRIGSKINSLNDVKKIIIKSIQGKVLRLEDFATLEIVEEKNDIRSYYQGHESLLLEVKKEADANAVEVASNIRKYIGQYIQKDQDIQFELIEDLGDKISNSIQNVVDNVLQGGFFSAIIILFFIQKWGPTFIIITAIPLSITVTLIGMYFLGMSFNMMSLAGLALGVGMLMDNSVVVLQSITIYRKKIDDYALASIVGTQKVMGAIIASTLTSVAVFLPLGFVEGTLGNMFKDISYTVVLSLLSSLVVALTVVPMLSSLKSNQNKEIKLTNPLLQQLKAYLTKNNKNYFSSRLGGISLFSKLLIDFITLNLIKKRIWFEGLFNKNKSGLIGKSFSAINTIIIKIENTLEHKINYIIKNKNNVVKVTSVLMIISLGIFYFKGAELVANDDAAKVKYKVEFLSNQSYEQMESKISIISKSLKNLDDVKNVTFVIGEEDRSRGSLYIDFEDNIKNITLTNKLIKNFLSKVPNFNYEEQVENLMSSEKPLQVEVYSEDSITLEKVSNLIFEELKNEPHLIGLNIVPQGKIDLMTLDFNREKLDIYQVNNQDFINGLKNQLNTFSSGAIPFNGIEYPVKVSVDTRNLKNIEQLKSFTIDKNGKPIYIGQVAKFLKQNTMKEIKHLNRKKVIVIEADLLDIDLKTASLLISKKINFITNKIENFKWKIGGSDEERKNSEKSLIISVILSITVTYLLLASQFENLLQPLIILVSVPLSLIGIAFILLIFGQNISAMVFVGIIILGGISANTSIVMVDSINQHLEEGYGYFEAVLKGTIERIRPILMSAISNVIGLIPMIFSTGQGEAMRKALAFTLIGGLTSSTILTMLIIPIIYSKLSSKKNNEEKV